MFRGSSWILIAFLLTQASADHQEDYSPFVNTDNCIGKGTCHDCIQTPLCAWCSASRFEGPRCHSYGNTASTTSTRSECAEEYVYNPDSQLTILRWDQLNFEANSSSSSDNDPTNPSAADRNRKIVQFSPQKLKLELRVHQAYNISVSYAPATELPLDVYYLSNLRQSTENDSLNYLIQLGEILDESLRNLTSNYRLGLGATVTNSSTGGNEQVYGFHHIISLSQNIRAVAEVTRNVEFSSNREAFEGGLDAILQAIVYRSRIGWRSDSLKIVVFSTGTAFPQDNNTTLSQDHPTISQINRIVQQNQINIIWSVTNEHYGRFSRLSTYVERSFVVRFTNDSTNLMDSIRNSYEAISSSVAIKDTSNSNVKVRYFSKCLDDEAVNETSTCEGLKFGTEVQFFAEIEAISCSQNSTEWNQQFSIYPVGVDESLTVSLRTICDCDCEHPGHPWYEPESTTCFGGGTLKCGICECDDLHFGRRCEAAVSGFGQSMGVRESDDHACRPNHTALVVCSGRGNCRGSVCDCEIRHNAEEVISGRFCECDNFSCDRYGDQICAGHGVCECGQCRCDAGWSGPACNCPTSNTTCVSPTGSGICSAHGECICGTCVCYADGGTRYSGRFCDKII